MLFKDDGDIVIGETLIDPYGIITDAKTGEIIVGAKVELYYADTGRNRQRFADTGENEPHTLVPLPELNNPPFPPANNVNPHYSDETGNYAWMVFPESDYYIIATKEGYHDYNSMDDVGVISVEYEIVEHNFKMVPKDPPTSSGSGGGGFFGGVIIPPMPKEDDEEVAKTTGIKIDLAIDLRADQRNYMEESTIHLTIDYINRSVRAASHVIITVDLPEFTKVMDLQGGTLSETGDQVSWYIERLAGKSPGQVQLTLEAEEILSQEYEVELKATIASSDDLINLVDDVSTLKFMLFSNEYGLFSHQRYIVGYPDGEFKANRYITRAEIANIFARILQLRSYVSNETLYSDVPQGKWYTDGIEAATKRGLFRGYSDGTFRPDQPITRAELTTVIFNFLQLEDRPPVTVNFSDITGHWAQNIISEVNRNRIAEGYMDGLFQPNNFLVRSEAVTMINRMLYRGPLHGAEPSYTDVDSNHWAFGDVEESTRSHEAIRNADSSEQFVREIETTLGF